MQFDIGGHRWWNRKDGVDKEGKVNENGDILLNLKNVIRT